MTRARLLPLGLVAVLCVDVRIDQVAYLDCHNEMFRAASRPRQDEAAPAASNPATAPSPSVGTYNQAALQEMLGRSLGHSTIPWRPAASVQGRLPR